MPIVAYDGLREVLEMADAMSLSRRKFVTLAGGTAALCSLGRNVRAETGPVRGVSLFDGRTLDGWIQIENNATSLSVGQIKDPAALLTKLASGTDLVSAFLHGKLEDLVKADLANYSPANPNAKALLSTAVKDLNTLVAGPSLYDEARFRGVTLRPQTSELLKQNPHGVRLARLNMLLLEDVYPTELTKSLETGWVVKDGAMASTGVGRGVIYSAKNYERYRLTFDVRHLSGQPDHYAALLVFCTRPVGDEKPLDALGGVQFGLPKGNHWDYRGGASSLGSAYFTSVAKVDFDEHAWSRVEVLADAAAGTARMAVAQPAGSRAVEVLAFKDAAGSKPGPIAFQMHNAGLFDEYKDIRIEVDPKDDRLITAG